MPPPKRKRSAMEEDAGKDPDSNAIQARDNDVLFGRGDCINRHPGNKKFRELVDAHKKTYLTSRFKQEKRMIADGIIAAIRSLDPPGRFLAKDANGQWQPVAEPRAREKTLQALREKARSARAQATANEPPRPSLPPEGLPRFQTNGNPVEAALLAGSGLPAIQPNPSLQVFSGSSGLPTAQGNPANGTLSAGLAPAAANTAVAASLGLPSSQNYPALAAALSAGVIPYFLNPSTTAGPAQPAPAPAPPSIQPSASEDSQAMSVVVAAPSPDRNSKTSITLTTAAVQSPASQASNNTAPMAPPPALPSGLRPGQGKGAVQQEISTRLMSPRKEEASLMPPPLGRQMAEASPASSATSASHTPRSQVQQSAALGMSPFSSGTFDALQRVAFPESPGLDQLLASATRPFSPRRLPPNQNFMGVQPVMPTNWTDPASALSPQVQAATRRRLTPHPRDQTDRPAQPVEYRQLNVNPLAPTMQPQAPNLFAQQQEQRETSSPMAYSPIPIITGAIDPEAPTPPIDSPFRRRLDMLRFLNDPAAASPTPSLTAPREVPLPRASLAPRARRTPTQNNQNSMPPHPQDQN